MSKTKRNINRRKDSKSRREHRMRVRQNAEHAARLRRIRVVEEMSDFWEMPVTVNPGEGH